MNTIKEMLKMFGIGLAVLLSIIIIGVGIYFYNGMDIIKTISIGYLICFILFVISIILGLGFLIVVCIDEMKG